MKLLPAFAAVFVLACLPSCESVASLFEKPTPAPIQRVVTKAPDGTMTMTETPIPVDTRDAFDRAFDRMAEGLKPLEGGNE